MFCLPRKCARRLLLLALVLFKILGLEEAICYKLGVLLRLGRRHDSLQKIKDEKSVYLSLCNPHSEKSCDI